MADGIREEREKLAAIRSMADMIVDTSQLTVHELRDIFMRMSRDGGGKRAEMVVTLLSFGFKHGLPEDADLAFDVRCLPNPHFVDRLRPLTGRDQPVVRYMRRHKATTDFIDRLSSFLTFALPHYVREGKTYLTVAIGCTGGQHRSVMVAEALQAPAARRAGRARPRDAPRFLRDRAGEIGEDDVRRMCRPASRSPGATSCTGRRPIVTSGRSSTSTPVTPSACSTTTSRTRP